jgi:hypothetical protein
MSTGDRNRVIVAEVVARCWQEDAYRARLLAEPVTVLQEAGYDFSERRKVRVYENSSEVTYAVLPNEDLEKFRNMLLSALEKNLPLPEGHEVRVIQNTDELLNIVLPIRPAAYSSHLSEQDLEAVAGGGSAYLVEAVAVATTANVAAEANAAAVQNAAAATEAAAAAVVVAVAAVVLT